MGHAEHLLRWGLGWRILGYGLLTFDRNSSAWAVLSMLLYVLPLALQFTAWSTARIEIPIPWTLWRWATACCAKIARLRR